MDYSDALLGTYIARRLRERNGAPLLRIGTDVFTRHDLARVECFNFLAAANLSAVLTEHLQVKNTRAVFETVAPADLALPHLGAVALAVLGAAFEAKGLGGDAPLENWAKRHLAKDASIVGFASLKKAARPAAPTTRRKRRRA